MQCSIKKSKMKTIRPRTFTEMRAALTSAESDVLDIIFFLMDKSNNPDQITYIIDIKEFEGLFYNNKNEIMSGKRLYEHLKNGIDGLYSIDLQFTEDTNTIKRGINFHVVGAKSWNDDAQKLGCQLNPMFLEIMKEQRGQLGYSIFELRYQFALKSTYSKRLYPMFNRFRKSGERFDNAEELRVKLGVPADYSQSKFLKILDNAIMDINEHTDLNIIKNLNSHTVRGGKMVDSFNWDIRVKNLNELSDKQSNCMRYLLRMLANVNVKESISDADAYRICEYANYDEQILTNAVDFMASYKHEIKDIVAFLISAINNKWTKSKNSMVVPLLGDSARATNDHDIRELERQLLSV